MPNQPKTPVRGVRVPDDLWTSAQEKAAREGTSVSEVVREALDLYVSGDLSPAR